jgi:phosphohistidine phosphatase SixA
VLIHLLRASFSEGDTDAHRFLTQEGRRLVRALGTKLLDYQPSFDRIVVSPSPAAVQTAELFAERVDFMSVIEVLPSLSPGAPPQVAGALLLTRGESIVVVADEPGLSNLGAFLVGRTSFPPGVPAQLSVIRDRRPEWYQRPDDIGRGTLLVAE